MHAFFYIFSVPVHVEREDCTFYIIIHVKGIYIPNCLVLNKSKECKINLTLIVLTQRRRN